MKKLLLIIALLAMTPGGFAKGWYVELQIGRPMTYNFYEFYSYREDETSDNDTIENAFNDISLTLGNIRSDKISCLYSFGYKQYFNIRSYLSYYPLGYDMTYNKGFGLYLYYGLSYKIVSLKKYNLEALIMVGAIIGKQSIEQNHEENDKDNYTYYSYIIGGAGGRLSLINRFFPEKDNSLFIAFDSDPVFIYLHQPKGFIAVINLSIKLGVRISLTQFSLR